VRVVFAAEAIVAEDFSGDWLQPSNADNRARQLATFARLGRQQLMEFGVGYA
jgi:hypothetical protein